MEVAESVPEDQCPDIRSGHDKAPRRRRASGGAAAHEDPIGIMTDMVFRRKPDDAATGRAFPVAAAVRKSCQACFIRLMRLVSTWACLARSATAWLASSMERAVSPAMVFTSLMERLISSLEADCSSLAVAMFRT